MVEFFASDTGLIVGLVCLAMGMADILIGWLWLYRRKGVGQADNLSKLKRGVPFLVSFDVVLVAIGCYTIYIHFVQTPHIPF